MLNYLEVVFVPMIVIPHKGFSPKKSLLLLTATTSNHTFLHSLQTTGLTSDWLPFNQSGWIQDKLHGGLPKKHMDAALNILALGGNGV